MDLDASLPWLALHLTPGLGARLTGKLLRQFGSPEEVFQASLTELEACRLPAATAQAVASRAAFRDAEKELAEVRRMGCGCCTGRRPHTRSGCWRSTIRRRCCMCAAICKFCGAMPSPWWARDVRPPTGIK